MAGRRAGCPKMAGRVPRKWRAGCPENGGQGAQKWRAGFMTSKIVHKPYNKKHCKIYVLKLWGFYILGFWENIFWEFGILEKIFWDFRNVFTKNVYQILS